MKIHILYEFVTGPYGGANQFLKALSGDLQRSGHLTPDINQADAVLVNANPTNLPLALKKLRQYRLRRPQGVVVFRIDGPIKLVRGRDAFIDHLIKQSADVYADGIIYQSRWSKEHFKTLTKLTIEHEKIIYNAPDNSIFYPAAAPPPQHRKIKLVATSWSANPRKGFASYTFLDKNLDWSRYEMTFIGNSPVKFKNIRVIPPLASAQLAEQLSQHDLYITASVNDPCSNSLIEALACDLPAIALQSGGHPELIQKGGLTFTNDASLLHAIEKATEQLPQLRARIPQFSLAKAAEQYYAFIEIIYLSKTTTRHNRPPDSRWRATSLRLHYAAWRLYKTFKVFSKRTSG